jgi:ATP-dependent DNA helicase RecG
MRPEILNPLFASATQIKGIGSKLEKVLAKLVNPQGAAAGHPARIIDLLLHVPYGLIDRRYRPSIAELPREGTVTVEARVMQHRPPQKGSKTPYKVTVNDGTGTLTLVFFQTFGDHLSRLLPVGEQRYISGKVEWYGGEAQIVHPDYVLTADQLAALPIIEPVYPLTDGIGGKLLGRAIRTAAERIPQLPEWLDPTYQQRHGWQDFAASLRALHHPETISGVGPLSPSRTRLAYDELLANQLALGLIRRHMKRAAGRQLKGDGRLRAKIISSLPYTLTAGQTQAIAEILADMAAPERMLRLLQGDVGSGKTIVALLALATVVECGAQGALMAPTEILSRQHFATLEPICAAAGVRIALLTGREKGKQREETLEKLRVGDCDILIGTHALFQEGVTFRDLGLAVIDEQHRFGVHQRLALQAKAGAAADLLVMTATPIPRTLALTVYGDMDVSRLTEKPAGRQAIDTRTIPLSRIDDVVDGIRRSLAKGQRIYWVCPLVEESDKVESAAAEERYAALAQIFPNQVGLVHGRMKGSAKDATMASFKAGAISILVATTVIEVGVDVPEATIIIVENAERFGLAQLHQLRGRVGRGSEKSACVLLYQEPLGETAKARLTILRETDDGFRIAEEDLRLRGAGEVLGTRQSGLPEFRLADISAHQDLMTAAHDDAALILRRDPSLKTERGEALRLLLSLFERDEAIKLLSSG